MALLNKLVMVANRANSKKLPDRKQNRSLAKPTYHPSYYEVVEPSENTDLPKTTPIDNNEDDNQVFHKAIALPQRVRILMYTS